MLLLSSTTGSRQGTRRVRVSRTIMLVPAGVGGCMVYATDVFLCVTCTQVKLLEVDTLGPAGVGRLGKAPSSKQPDNLSGDTALCYVHSQ